MDLEKLNLVELNTSASCEVTGGMGYHAAGYTTAQESSAAGAFHVGVVYGFVSGLYNRWFS